MLSRQSQSQSSLSVRQPLGGSVGESVSWLCWLLAGLSLVVDLMSVSNCLSPGCCVKRERENERKRERKRNTREFSMAACQRRDSPIAITHAWPKDTEKEKQEGDIKWLLMSETNELLLPYSSPNPFLYPFSFLQTNHDPARVGTTRFVPLPFIKLLWILGDYTTWICTLKGAVRKPVWHLATGNY